MPIATTAPAAWGSKTSVVAVVAGSGGKMGALKVASASLLHVLHAATNPVVIGCAAGYITFKILTAKQHEIEGFLHSCEQWWRGLFDHSPTTATNVPAPDEAAEMVMEIAPLPPQRPPAAAAPPVASLFSQIQPPPSLTLQSAACVRSLNSEGPDGIAFDNHAGVIVVAGGVSAIRGSEGSGRPLTQWLADTAREKATAQPIVSVTNNRASDLIVATWEAAERSGCPRGASTIAVAALNQVPPDMAQGRGVYGVDMASFGDSVAMVLWRDAEDGELHILSRTEPMMVNDNAPRQLSFFPPRHSMDPPPATLLMALQEHRLATSEGDLLLCLSPGVTNILCDDDIETIINRMPGSPTAHDVASAVCSAACANSTRRDSLTASGNVEGRLGGRADDISVVAAWVVPREGRIR
ncbi:unnamed protein product [Vitrella brassicaformis CCMP3155]|uniref:Uncharacterized protein n=1 Tax=Vitrella brassicaformis (strain CCMP3155) TaxID=1169540 RepID=A0A0G4GA89_VITBC|nr:unnamed protein product [Vitrella brassicaformis CCMP3155]|eukprot:CEM25862.1 unnamed protein product [Vitrella brassicaformis CCMP3155]